MSILLYQSWRLPATGAGRLCYGEPGKALAAQRFPQSRAEQYEGQNGRAEVEVSMKGIPSEGSHDSVASLHGWCSMS